MWMPLEASIAVLVPDYSKPSPVVAKPVLTNQDIEEVERLFLQQVPKMDEAPLAEGEVGVRLIECPVTHRFEPGVYIREIFMPAGSFVIGHEHLTKHQNVILCGRAEVTAGGPKQTIVGPCVFESAAGVRKTLLVLEDMRWMTLHPNPTNERDIERLEDSLRVKSDSFQNYELSRTMNTLTGKES
jgi:hypothetical protein